MRPQAFGRPTHGFRTRPNTIKKLVHGFPRPPHSFRVRSQAIKRHNEAIDPTTQAIKRPSADFGDERLPKS